jgi:hypothetical protein
MLLLCVLRFTVTFIFQRQDDNNDNNNNNNKTIRKLFPNNNIAQCKEE